MKSMILVALALMAVAVALPVEEPVKILRSEFDSNPEGGYNYGYEAENGIKLQENGEIKEVVDEENNPHKVIVVRGSYSYPRPDGVEETITYVADENGFQAQGPSIPKNESR